MYEDPFDVLPCVMTVEQADDYLKTLARVYQRQLVENMGHAIDDEEADLYERDKPSTNTFSKYFASFNHMESVLSPVKK